MLIAKYFGQFGSLHHEQSMLLIVVFGVVVPYSLLGANQYSSETMVTTYKTTPLQHREPLKFQMYKVLSKRFHSPFGITRGKMIGSICIVFFILAG
jgi:hypothetical protein